MMESYHFIFRYNNCLHWCLSLSQSAKPTANKTGQHRNPNQIENLKQNPNPNLIQNRKQNLNWIRNQNHIKHRMQNQNRKQNLNWIRNQNHIKHRMQNQNRKKKKTLSNQKKIKKESLKSVLWSLQTFSILPRRCVFHAGDSGRCQSPLLSLRWSRSCSFVRRGRVSVV